MNQIILSILVGLVSASFILMIETLFLGLRTLSFIFFGVLAVTLLVTSVVINVLN